MCSIIMNHARQPSQMAGFMGLRLTAPLLAPGESKFLVETYINACSNQDLASGPRSRIGSNLSKSYGGNCQHGDPRGA